MSSMNNKLESFPLIMSANRNDSNSNDAKTTLNHEINDWSDQELDDIFQSPIEDVLKSMRYQSAKHVSRRQCLLAIVYFSIISFVIGASFSFLVLTTLQISLMKPHLAPQSPSASVSSKITPDDILNRKQNEPLVKLMPSVQSTPHTLTNVTTNSTAAATTATTANSTANTSHNSTTNNSSLKTNNILTISKKNDTSNNNNNNSSSSSTQNPNDSNDNNDNNSSLKSSDNDVKSANVSDSKNNTNSIANEKTNKK